MSGLHADACRVMEGWVAPDPAQEQLRRQYVAHLHAHPDGVWRSCLPDHLTASTLVLDPTGDHVLLTLHSKARQWFQFGGHLEDGDPTLAAAALREATEESGVTGLRLHPVPVHLDDHEVPFCGGRPGTHHLDIRFLAVAPAGAEHAVSAESVDVRWWPVDALPSQEASLGELVDLGRRRLGVL